MSRIIRKAWQRTSPASSNAAQNRGSSRSDSTRSRAFVGFRSMPEQGLAWRLATSFLSAQAKTADAAASTWLARTGEPSRVILLNTARTSARVMGWAGSFAQRGSK